MINGILTTRIPEDHRVRGLRYGAYESRPWCGCSYYYVRPEGSAGEYYLAQLTPASDQCYETDEEIVAAIREEILYGPDDPCPACMMPRDLCDCWEVS
jgi:hypothetical protein